MAEVICINGYYKNWNFINAQSVYQLDTKKIKNKALLCNDWSIIVIQY